MNRVMDWAKAHPRLTAWIVLGLGMDGMVAYEARTVGLQPGQWVALIVATTLVAGLCVWIIGWEDDEETAAGSGTPAASAPAGAATPAGKAGAKPAEAPAKKPAPRKAPAKRASARKSKR